jgi:hypothetical protein
VAGGNDLEATQGKLNDFLDEFKTNYSQLVQEGYLDPTTLDRIFGDVGDVLVELLEQLFAGAGAGGTTGNAAGTIIDKVLSVAELILHDDKVRDPRASLFVSVVVSDFLSVSRTGSAFASFVATSR